jgi:hypothetical protein
MGLLGPTSAREPVDELAAMRMRLEAIDHLTKTTARADTLEDIYGAALDAVAAALGASRSSVLLFDPDGVIRFIRFKAWRRLSDSYRRATERHTPWRPDTIAAEPVLVSDVRTLEHCARLELPELAESTRIRPSSTSRC